MSEKILEVATKLVELALKYKDQWPGLKELEQEELQVLFDAVKAAGFEPKSIVPGQIIGYYLDKSGNKTKDIYQINAFCPFKVICQNAVYRFVKNHDFATGWLDCAIRRIVSGIAKRREDTEELIEVISAEIERSLPLAPIRLNSENDWLCEHSPNPTYPTHSGFEYFVDHTKDDSQLTVSAGVHRFCRGHIRRLRVNQVYDALWCERCSLTISFTKNVDTYGDLREALKKFE